MSFQRGDKVVCVGRLDNGENKAPVDAYIVIGNQIYIGSVYVVERIIAYPWWPSNVMGVALVGSTSKLVANGFEVGWDSRCFRKLEELKQEAKDRAGEAAFWESVKHDMSPPPQEQKVNK